MLRGEILGEEDIPSAEDMVKETREQLESGEKIMSDFRDAMNKAGTMEGEEANQARLDAYKEMIAGAKKAGIDLTKQVLETWNKKLGGDSGLQEFSEKFNDVISGDGIDIDKEGNVSFSSEKLTAIEDFINGDESFDHALRLDSLEDFLKTSSERIEANLRALDAATPELQKVLDRLGDKLKSGGKGLIDELKKGGWIEVDENGKIKKLKYTFKKGFKDALNEAIENNMSETVTDDAGNTTNRPLGWNELKELMSNKKFRDAVTASGDSTEGGKTSTLKTILGFIKFLIISGGILAGVLYIAKLSASLTGCYRYGPKIDDTNGPLQLTKWMDSKGNLKQDIVTANCSCGNIRTPEGNPCNKEELLTTSTPAPTEGEPATPDNCKSPNDLLPMCANSGGCDPLNPICFGYEGSENQDFIAYGFQSVNPFTIGRDILKGAAGLGAGIPEGIKKIITYIAIGIGILLFAYAAYAIFRSFSSGGGEKTVEIKAEK